MYEIIPTLIVLAAFFLGFNLNILWGDRKNKGKGDGGVDTAAEGDVLM